MFDRGAFEATLEMVLNEFENRYRLERIEPLWQPKQIRAGNAPVRRRLTV